MLLLTPYQLFFLYGYFVFLTITLSSLEKEPPHYLTEILFISYIGKLEKSYVHNNLLECNIKIGALYCLLVQKKKVLQLEILLFLKSKWFTCAEVTVNLLFITESYKDEYDLNRWVIYLLVSFQSWCPIFIRLLSVSEDFLFIIIFADVTRSLFHIRRNIFHRC